MKIVLTFFLSLFASCSFSQGKDLLSWYKMLTGKIDGDTLTMNLHKAGHKFFGYYYYEVQQQPIYFVGEDTTAKGRIKLVSFSNPAGTDEFDFLLSGNNANGTLKREGKKRPLVFTAVETAPPILFKNVFTDGVAKLRTNVKDSPEATFEASSVWPVGNTVTSNFLKTIINLLFNYNGNEEIESLLVKKKEAYFRNYHEKNKNVKETDLLEKLPFYTMAVSDRLIVAYQSSKLLTLAFSSYSYRGGAHGDYGTRYACLDLTNRRKLKLSDVVTVQGQQLISGLLEKYFRLTHNLSSNDSLEKVGLFNNRISPNDNFYATPKGINFNYNPAEIGPYAMGEINIFIPIKDLEKYLRPTYRTLIE